MGRRRQGGGAGEAAGTDWGEAPAVAALADSLPLPLLVADPRGRVLRANAAYREALGEPPPGGWLALVADGARGAAEALWLEAATARAPREAALALGGAGTARLRIAPVEAEGRLLGWTLCVATEAAETPAEPPAGAPAEPPTEPLPPADLGPAPRMAPEDGPDGREPPPEAPDGEAALLRLLAGTSAIGALRPWIEAAPAPIWASGPDGVPVLQAPALRALGADWPSLVHPSDRARVLGLWGAAVEAVAPFEARHRVVAAGAPEPAGEATSLARPVRDAMGRLVGWIGAMEPVAASEADGKPEPTTDADDPGAPPTDPAAQPVASEPDRPPDPCDEPPLPPPAEPGDEETWLDALAGRLRSEALAAALARWRGGRGAGRVPPFAGWEDGAPADCPQALVEVGEDGAPRRLRVVRSGPDTPLLRALAAQPGGGAAGWRLSLEAPRPAHDYAELALGGAGALSVERLLLPFSTGGGRVDRLLLLVASGRS